MLVQVEFTGLLRFNGCTEAWKTRFNVLGAQDGEVPIGEMQYVIVSDAGYADDFKAIKHGARIMCAAKPDK